MKLITLTTDLGVTDYYAAIAKGRLYSELPDATIVDVTHEIPKHDIQRTAFVVKQTWRNFPKGTIHIVAVQSLESERVSLVACSHEGHFFVCADNGIIPIFLGAQPEEVVQLDLGKSQMPSFPLLGAFVQASIRLANGEALSKIGKKKSSVQEMLMQSPPIGENHIRANIVYIDTFGNLITNVSREKFEEVGKGLRFEIQLPQSRLTITRISERYNEVATSAPLALFGHSGLLEIAVSQGSAARMIGLKVNEVIRIEFYAD
jgi:S-adenosylmethionine hydrolase